MALARKVYHIKGTELPPPQREGGGSTYRLSSIDGVQEDCIWGRMKIKASVPDGSVIVVRYYASDVREPREEQATKKTGFTDLSLYEQRGRYLWIWIDLYGREASLIEEVQVFTPGDPFINTFPEIYREHGSFFHRFLSIFSSVYLDFQQEIDELPMNFDVCTAPPALLPHLGRWVGIDFDKVSFDEAAARALIRESAHSNSYRGTAGVIERVAVLTLGCDMIIMERNQMDTMENPAEKALCDRLYGDSALDFTLLAVCEPKDCLRDRLAYLLELYKPARSRANIVFLNDLCRLDGYCYLELNARIIENMQGILDNKTGIDTNRYLAAQSAPAR